MITVVELFVRFMVKKRLWRMPSHTYWVVTPSLLHVFEFRFVASTRLRREVGAWSRPVVDAKRGTKTNQMWVRLPGEGRPFEMEGDRFTAGEAEVIRLMTAA